MRSIKCENCGLFNWAESGACKRCGAQLEAPQDSGPSYSNYNQQQQQYYQQQQTGYAAYPSYAGVQAQRKSGLAITSMVLGIISVIPFTIGGFLGIGAISGLVLGIVGYKKSKNRPAEYGGGGMAIAGIVLSSFALLIMIPIVAAIAIPNLLASRRAADEGSALSMMRQIHSAEQTFQATTGNNNYGSMEELVSANLLSPEMLSGQRHGYRFAVRASGIRFEALATPLTYGATGSGIRSFYVNDDGVIRAADRGGMEATASDPPYDQRNEYNERAENSHAGHFQVVDESSCVRTLRSIHVAEETYRATDSSGNYGTMQQLVFKNLLSNEMLNSQRSGYNFAVRTNGATFEAMATPASYTSGTRSFYIGQEGVIRAADRGGYAASTNDPPYDASSRSY